MLARGEYSFIYNRHLKFMTGRGWWKGILQAHSHRLTLLVWKIMSLVLSSLKHSVIMFPKERKSYRVSLHLQLE